MSLIAFFCTFGLLWVLRSGLLIILSRCYVVVSVILLPKIFCAFIKPYAHMVWLLFNRGEYRPLCTEQLRELAPAGLQFPGIDSLSTLGSFQKVKIPLVVSRV